MDYSRIIRGLLRDGDLTQAELAELVGVTQPTVSRWLKGQKPEIDQHRRLVIEAGRKNLPEFVAALGGAALEHDEEEEPPSVPVKGWVGAGSQAVYFPEETEYDRAPAVPGMSDRTIALEIRGTSLGELFDRWFVYVDDIRTPVTADLIGKTCVVGLADGRMLVKKLRRANGGLFDLLSNTEEPIRGVAVHWAAKVKHMGPR